MRWVLFSPFSEVETEVQRRNLHKVTTIKGRSWTLSPHLTPKPIPYSLPAASLWDVGCGGRKGEGPDVQETHTAGWSQTQGGGRGDVSCAVHTAPEWRAGQDQCGEDEGPMRMQTAGEGTGKSAWWCSAHIPCCTTGISWAWDLIL